MLAGMVFLFVVEGGEGGARSLLALGQAGAGMDWVTDREIPVLVGWTYGGICSVGCRDGYLSEGPQGCWV